MCAKAPCCCSNFDFMFAIVSKAVVQEVSEGGAHLS